MTITVDWTNKVVESTASILDAVVCHQTLRDLEDDPTGMLYPITHTWKALDMGGGAFFYQLDLINGYQWKFPNPGNYTMKGNIKGTLIPVAGVFVERETSAAYITTAVGGSGPTASDIAAAVVAALTATTIPTDVRKVNGDTITGHGIPPTYDNSGSMTNAGDPWRPA